MNDIPNIPKPVFNGHPGFVEAFGLANPFNRGCSWYSIPGGISSIQAFFSIIILLTLLFIALCCFSFGYFKVGGIITAVAILTNILPIFTNAYLRKGCEASELLKELQSKKTELPN